MADYISPIVTSCVSLAVGFGAGYMTHCLSSKRDREARDHATMSATKERKRTFLAFLSEWRAKISMPQRGPDTFGIGSNPAVDSYYDELPTFKAKVELVKEDFSVAERFTALADRLGNLKKEDWQHKQPREVILHAIDELTRFVS